MPFGLKIRSHPTWDTDSEPHHFGQIRFHFICSHAVWDRYAIISFGQDFTELGRIGSNPNWDELGATRPGKSCVFTTFVYGIYVFT